MNNDIIGIILIAIAALELLSGIYIFVTRVKGHLVYSHSLIVLGVVMWVFGNGMYQLVGDAQTAFFWARLFYIGSVILTIAFVYFSYAFPYFLKPISTSVILLFLGSLLYFLWLFGFTDRGIAGVALDTSGVKISYGPVHHMYVLWFFTMFVWGFANLLQKLKTAGGIHRWLLRNIFVGILLSFIFGATFGLVLPVLGGPQWFYVSAGSSIFWLAFVTYMMFGRWRET